MTKFRIGSTAALVALAVSSCVVSPESEDENIGTDVEALCAGAAGLVSGCGCPPPPPLPPPLPPPCPDLDYDNVCDYDDLCLGTYIPEDVPLRGLAVNHFALINDDLVFDTIHPGRSPERIFTIYDTGGCSCEQILYELGGRRGQYLNGCSFGTMKNWVRFVDGLYGHP